MTDAVVVKLTLDRDVLKRELELREQAISVEEVSCTERQLLADPSCARAGVREARCFHAASGHRPHFQP
jgi:hypothetical protein